MPQSNGSIPALLGTLLSRVIVPLWVLAGAVLKLSHGEPDNLPKGIWQPAYQAGLDLDWLLATLISLEFMLVAVMVFIARLARPAAVFTLSVFCLVLLNELRIGNFTSCGCLGNVPMKPWQMLVIDGTLLAGVIACWIMDRRPQLTWKYGPIAASVATLACATLSFSLILAGPAVSPVPDGNEVAANDRSDATEHAAPRDENASEGVPQSDTGPEPTDTPPPADDAQPAAARSRNNAAVPPATATDPRRNPAPRQAPSNWFPDNVSAWVGKPWREIDLFQFMPIWPSDMDGPKRYVVFYSRTCEHCEEMFHFDLIVPLDAPVTAIEIPTSRTQLTASNAWPLPETDCELMALPLGTTWLMTPPLALRIENGIVTCATEGDHKSCLGLE